MKKYKIEDILIKIGEVIGMIIGLPLAILFNVYGLSIVIGISWILISDDEMEPGEIVAKVGAIILLIKLIQFIVNKIKQK